MSIIEYFETLNDSEIIAMFKGKSIKVKYKNGQSLTGVITNFLLEAHGDDPNRRIIGIIINGTEEIVISTFNIESINIE